MSRGREADSESVGGISLHGMAHGGEAVGRAPDGRAAFVAGGLPGETVDVRIGQSRPRFVRGVIERLPDTPAPARIRPACAHFGQWPIRGLQPSAACGGCQWQHIDYGAQLEHKRTIVLDALERIGGLRAPTVLAVSPAPEPWGYRNILHTRLLGGRPSLVALSGRDLVPLDTCPIAHPLVLDLISDFDAELPDGTPVTFRAGVNTGEQLILVEDLEDGIDDVEVGSSASVVLLRSDGLIEVAAGRSYLVERVGAHEFEVPAGAFFQTNTAMAERMVEIVGELLPEKLVTLVDLFGGVGLIGLSHAGRAEAVSIIDSDPSAIEAATRNAAGMDHVTLVEGDAIEGFDYVRASGAVDCAIVDPPRSGLSAALVELLGREGPDTLLYASCEPSALARDVARLTAAGYRMDVCAPLDMFPQTFHVECICRLVRGAADAAFAVVGAVAGTSGNDSSAEGSRARGAERPPTSKEAEMAAKIDPEFARQLDRSPDRRAEAIVTAAEDLTELIRELPGSLTIEHEYRLIKAVAVAGRGADILALASVPAVGTIEAVGDVSAQREVSAR